MLLPLTFDKVLAGAAPVLFCLFDDLRMMDLRDVVGSFLATAVSDANLLTSAENLVVGVSGGADSLALLHVLTQLVQPSRLVVAHLNHQYRETAVAEMAFVSQVAGDWGCQFAAKTVDVAAAAAQHGTSVEEAGRTARYDFFGAVAQQYRTTYIFVGHHADDQAETVLMNLLRGTGLPGLRGMLPVTALTQGDAVQVLRPFLTINRRDIDWYCSANRLTPVYDETNVDPSFFRNRIRQELLPLLESYNSGIQRHLRQLAEMVRADVAVLDQLVADTWMEMVQEVDASEIVIDRAAWMSLPVGLKRRVLRRAVFAKRPFLQDVSFQVIEQARLLAEKNQTGQKVDLPAGLWLVIHYERIIIAETPELRLEDWPQLSQDSPLPLPIPGKVKLEAGWWLETSLVEEADLKALKNQATAWQVFVAYPPGQDWVVRPRRAGERFQPLGMNGRSAKVKEVMINRKLGAAWRKDWPIVANQTHLVWLVGHMIDERIKINIGKNEQIIQLRCFKG
ncbi:MAG: tRNA lysidine(34) synthetase TilS [Chloroflexi bacterium]|nr:MAG: tRNA lysidine(34) synthetase TilS [Chloroflexota bacterium]